MGLTPAVAAAPSTWLSEIRKLPPGTVEFVSFCLGRSGCLLPSHRSWSFPAPALPLVRCLPFSVSKTHTFSASRLQESRVAGPQGDWGLPVPGTAASQKLLRLEAPGYFLASHCPAEELR